MQPPLRIVAQRLAKTRLSPDLATVIGLCIGMGAVPALLYRLYWVALVCILLNRIIDGLDGILARMGNPTDAGGFLDIALDFIFRYRRQLSGLRGNGGQEEYQEHRLPAKVSLLSRRDYGRNRDYTLFCRHMPLALPFSHSGLRLRRFMLDYGCY